MSIKSISNLKDYYLPIAVTIAVLLRVAYWISVGSEPWFQTPGMDPEFYLNWSSAIIGGNGGDYLPFPRAPLYPYILSGIRTIFGDWWVLPRLFNLLCDVLTTILVWSIAKRASSRDAGFFATLLIALSGISIYMSGELLMTSLETMLATAFLWFFIRTIETQRWLFATYAGIFAALFSLCRPNGLLLVFAAPVIIVIIGFTKQTREDEKNRNNGRLKTPSDYFGIVISRLRGYFLDNKSINTALAMLLSAIFCISPVAYFNYAATGKIIPVATQGGVNFFIGNARGATGWSSTLPGVGADWTENDAARLANNNAGKMLPVYEQSQQFWKMGLEEIRADFGAWLKLMTQKTLLLLNIREIGNNRPLSLPCESAPYLQWLLLISFGGIIPFAVIGVYASRYDRPLLISLGSFFILFGGSLLLFFISSRYRTPMFPAIAILAGIGINHIAEKWQSNLKTILSIFAISALITIPPWTGSSFDEPTQGYFVIGNALLKQGKPVEARQFYDRTKIIEPDYPRLHLNIGAAFLREGDTSNAIQEFEKELTLFPDRGDALNNLAAIYERRGNTELAKKLYFSAMSKTAGASDAGENLLRLTLKEGDRDFQFGKLDSAESKYRMMADLFNQDYRPFYRMAIVRATQGDYISARNLLKKVIILHPEYQPALELLRELP